MAEKKPEQMTREELVAVLRRFNPFGGYCVEPCQHPGHSDDAYRKTVIKLRDGFKSVVDEMRRET